MKTFLSRSFLCESEMSKFSHNLDRKEKLSGKSSAYPRTTICIILHNVFCCRDIGISSQKLKQLDDIRTISRSKGRTIGRERCVAVCNNQSNPLRSPGTALLMLCSGEWYHLTFSHVFSNMFSVHAGESFSFHSSSLNRNSTANHEDVIELDWNMLILHHKRGSCRKWFERWIFLLSPSEERGISSLSSI